MATPAVINSKNESSPFDHSRLVGSLVVAGLDGDSAVSRARLVDTIFQASEKDAVTTDDIRYALQEIATHPDRPDVANILRYLRRPTVTVEVGQTKLGISISPAAFMALTAQYLEFMKAERRPSVQDAISLTRIWNSIGYWGLAGIAEQYAAYSDMYFAVYLENCVEILGATLSKGLGYYSKAHDLTIGGTPNSNSIYKDIVNIKKVEGGVTDHTFDATCTIETCECDGLQCIQVFWGTRRKDGLKVGDKELTKDGKTWDTFVDGGTNSPYCKLSHEPPAHPTKPYYLTPKEVDKQVDDCKSIRVYDQPGAIVAHEEGYFETAIICINYKKSGKDKVIKVFKWGWKNFGKDYLTSPGSGGKNSGLEEYDTVSQEFRDTVAHDYPGYSFD